MDGQSEGDPSTTTDPGTSTDPSDASGPGIDLTSTFISGAGSTWFDPANQTLFRGGPQRPQRLEKLVSGSIDTAREVDRFAISAAAGSVVSLSVAADPGTWPKLRLVDADGRELAKSSAYNKSTASTSGWLSDGRDLFAEVHAQQSFTGSYDLTAMVWETQQPLLEIPDALNILLDNTSLSSGDRYSSHYLYADDGLIYVSFGDGITAELQRWWEDVLASTDAIIEPEFVVVPLPHPKSQLTLNQISASSVSDGAGHYQSPPYTHSKLEDGSSYDYRRTEPTGEIVLSEGVYSHAYRFADSLEAGWKSTAFHELGHALGLEHPHEFSDGDGDDVIDTNGTVMSYVDKQDADGDPGFTTLDIQALQFIYGRESGRTTPSPITGSPLVIQSRTFDLDRRWKAPALSAEWVGGSQVMEPSAGTTVKTLQLTRSEGDISSETRVLLEFDLDPNVMLWDSYADYSEGFHDILILSYSVTFAPGEATATFDLPVVAGSHAEADEWVDVTLVPEYSNFFSAVPGAPLRLTILDS
ncbi:M43 family zinc metalloprotease [Synechococcus sp. CC9616]|uniref:M43 family zinc metalloprotease n=1 Tax=Synechococcus sp. CC9616 TaxID=110663 RepID=UPI001E3D41A6|nr:M43 family zinc metalloprotease [Synechococcus sp. CC9616]